MQLITGYTGTPHVTAQDDSIRNVMLGEFGGRGVFPILDRFSATAVTANEVRVSSGYGINQGRLFKINRNDYDSCIIENGTAGYKRVDLIVARYTRDEQTGIENCELVVIKGTPNANAYVDPQYNTGVILDGDLIDDMLMYRVKLDGVTVADVEQMFTVYESLIGGIEPIVSAQVDRDFNAKLSANQQAFDQMLLDDDTAFETWFASVQVMLDQETATKLTNAVAKHDQNFADVENNTTASKAYAVGELLVNNNRLYKATSAIASGDTLAVGTNIERAKVEDVMGTAAFASAFDTRLSSKRVLLWENPIPGGNFEPQTISLADNISEYGGGIEIVFKGANGFDEIKRFGYSSPYNLNAGLESLTFPLSESSKASYYARRMLVNDNTITFYAGYIVSASESTLDNHVAVPRAIYGIKE